MSSGTGMLARARQHIGEAYENVLVPKDNPNWHGPWDCAEFMSWLVYQEARILYGCVNDSAQPAVADAYTGAWKTDVERLGERISVAQAAATVGAIVLRYPPQPGTMGHIAISDGQGGTVEAKGHKFGVVADTLQGRRWDTGVLIPGITYQGGAPVALPAVPTIYYSGAANLDPAVVTRIQQALAALKFDPGTVDGQYGPHTAAAVAAFQTVQGFVVDGEVGPQTAAALNVVLT